MMWKSDLPIKKTDFLSSSCCIKTTLRMFHMDADKTYWEKAGRKLLENVTSYIEQILEVTFYKRSAVRQLTSNH